MATFARTMARRVGVWGGLFVALSAAAGVWAFARTDAGEPVRAVINRIFTPYDGCMCEDCTEHFLLIPPPRGCVRTGGPEILAGLCWFTSGGTLLLLTAGPSVAGRWRRARSAAFPACVGCGYPREGIAGRACPECGHAESPGAGVDAG